MRRLAGEKLGTDRAVDKLVAKILGIDDLVRKKKGPDWLRDCVEPGKSLPGDAEQNQKCYDKCRLRQSFRRNLPKPGERTQCHR